MADKIVQLIDDQNDNIYPISRGLAANSVDTNAIQDGAVTSDKIDSATYTTTEKVVGTWIDGKPIYRKTWSGTVNLAAETVSDIDLATPVETIVNSRGMFGYYYNSGSFQYANFGAALNEGAVYSATMRKIPNYLVLRFRTQYIVDNAPYVVSIDYTKPSA